MSGKARCIYCWEELDLPEGGEPAWHDVCEIEPSEWWERAWLKAT